MSEAQVIDIVQQAVWLILSISAPILTVALIMGVVIGLFQALTSIQELTLTFVPKLVAVLGTIWLTAAAMSDVLVNFFQGPLLDLVVGV